jgi:hypothetical protein
MATVTLVSAKGSPGASTLTIGMSLAWSIVAPGRSALAVDADPAGGDFAAGVLGGVLPAGSGMIPLATARGVPAVEAVGAAAVHLREDGTARLIAGVPDPARAAALELAWDTLAAARPDLDRADEDLIVDAGRVDLSRPPAPWMIDCDLALLVVRPTLPAVTAAHRFARTWRTGGAATAATPLELVVVDSPSPYAVGEVADAVGLECRGVLPYEPVHARVHSDGIDPTRGFARSGYARALTGLTRAVVERIEVLQGSDHADGGRSEAGQFKAARVEAARVEAEGASGGPRPGGDCDPALATVRQGDA